jgi:hypothetical protein
VSYNILKAEIGKDSPDDNEIESMVRITVKTFDIIEEKTAIVEFFRKDDGIKD